MMDEHWAYNSRCTLVLHIFFFFFNVNLPTCPASDLTELSDDALLPHLYELLLWNATSEGGLERSCTEARAMKFILELLC